MCYLHGHTDIFYCRECGEGICGCEETCTCECFRYECPNCRTLFTKDGSDLTPLGTSETEDCYQEVMIMTDSNDYVKQYGEEAVAEHVKATIKDFLLNGDRANLDQKLSVISQRAAEIMPEQKSESTPTSEGQTQTS